MKKNSELMCCCFLSESVKELGEEVIPREDISWEEIPGEETVAAEHLAVSTISASHVYCAFWKRQCSRLKTSNDGRVTHTQSFLSGVNHRKKTLEKKRSVTGATLFFLTKSYRHKETPEAQLMS